MGHLRAYVEHFLLGRGGWAEAAGPFSCSIVRWRWVIAGKWGFRGALERLEPAGLRRSLETGGRALVVSYPSQQHEGWRVRSGNSLQRWLSNGVWIWPRRRVR